MPWGLKGTDKQIFSGRKGGEMRVLCRGGGGGGDNLRLESNSRYLQRLSIWERGRTKVWQCTKVKPGTKNQTRKYLGRTIEWPSTKEVPKKDLGRRRKEGGRRSVASQLDICKDWGSGRERKRRREKQIMSCRMEKIEKKGGHCCEILWRNYGEACTKEELQKNQKRTKERPLKDQGMAMHQRRTKER